MYIEGLDDKIELNRYAKIILDAAEYRAANEDINESFRNSLNSIPDFALKKLFKNEYEYSGSMRNEFGHRYNKYVKYDNGTFFYKIGNSHFNNSNTLSWIIYYGIMNCECAKSSTFIKRLKKIAG